MSIVEIAVMSFAILGFAVIGIAFWAAWYPKKLCQKTRDLKADYNVCIRCKDHDGPCMDANGRKFQKR